MSDVDAGWPDGEGPLRREPPVVAASDDEALIVDVAGFEGPLDLLLELARGQKVDLKRISILALAEQYLAFIAAARQLRLELAADYLVMAAWLAYLKSRLLLPPPHADGEPPPEDLAARLAFRLQRLQAMREASTMLMARNRLGRDVFGRGAPEPLVIDRQPAYADNLIDLLKAYAQRRQKSVTARDYRVVRQPVLAVAEARRILERLIGGTAEWGRFDAFLADYLSEPAKRSSVLASSLTASLEMAREGILELRQAGAFGPIYLRRKS
jgi:segregation and condensation protein A